MVVWKGDVCMVRKMIMLVCFMIVLTGCSAGQVDDSKKDSREKTSIPEKQENRPTKEPTRELTKAPTKEPTKEPTVPPIKAPSLSLPNDFIDNDLWKVSEEFYFKNSRGKGVLIVKVKAKKDCVVLCNVIAENSAGDIIGKEDDTITLTSGKENFFAFRFSSDIEGAVISANWTVKKEPLYPREAVELVKYSTSGNELFLTVKQVKEELSGQAGYKLLFYKAGKIVDYKDDLYFFGYTSDFEYVRYLDGQGSSNTISIDIRGLDFDNLEFYFEP